MQLSFVLGVVLAEDAIIDLDGTFFIQLAIFFVIFLLRPLVFRPLLAVYRAREEAIEGAKGKALQVEEEAAVAARRFEEELSKAKAQAGEERERLRAEGVRLEKTLLEGVRKDIQGALESAKTKLNEEDERIRAELEETVPQLAQQITDKLLSRPV